MDEQEVFLGDYARGPQNEACSRCIQRCKKYAASFDTCPNYKPNMVFAGWIDQKPNRVRRGEKGQFAERGKADA